MHYRRQADKLLRHGAPAERKQLVRTLVGEVKLIHPGLEGHDLLLPARGPYEWIGCGGLQRSERAFPALSP